MHAPERTKLILNYLNEHESASIHELCDLTSSSIATVRRDLNAMSQDGLIIKMHGGAKKAHKSVTGNIVNQSDIPDLYAKERTHIAKVAANLIHPGDHIFLGSGRTCTLLAREIKNIPDLTIVTTNINAVVEFSSSPNVSVLLLGGSINYSAHFIETFGEYTAELVSQISFDKAFFTVDGIDFEFGYSITHRSRTSIYNFLIKNCRNCYLLADYSKFGKRIFSQLCSLTKIPNVITDSKVDSQYLNYYRSHGINVLIC